jgi:sulfite reductase alpha subunit-like flavoprotein
MPKSVLSQCKNPLCILYGSATGNSEHIAKDLAASINQNISLLYPIFDGVICAELDQYKKSGCLQVWETPMCHDDDQLAYKSRGLLVICSTTGNGDAPENACRFVRHIKKAATALATQTKNAAGAGPPMVDESLSMFRNVCYAVLGLGDTNYDQFCAAAVAIDRNLHLLGGVRCKVNGKAALTCADEGSGQLEDVVEPWVASIVQDIISACRRDEVALNGNICTVKEYVTVPALEALSIDPSIDLVDPSASPADAFINPVTPVKSLGVQMIQSILSHSNNTENADIDIDPSTLPSLLSQAATKKVYTLIQDDVIDERTEYMSSELPLEHQQQRLRGLSIASASGVGDDTVSSVSAGYYYTIQNPYHSKIMDARYLTETSVSAATQVVSKMNSANDESISHGAMYMTSVLYKDAETLYDAAFPLWESDIIDTAAIERNGKRVIELTLSLPDDSTLEYAPGDSLGMIVDNSVACVDYILGLLQKNDPSITNPYRQMILLESDSTISHRQMTPVSIFTSVSRNIDLCSVVKNKRMLLAFSRIASDIVEAQYLRLLSSKTPLGELLFQKVIEEQRMNFVDILESFPSTQSGITLETLFALAPTSIPPRYYSVSSSPLHFHDDHLTIAFSVVDYVTPSFTLTSPQGQVREVGGRRIRGLATRYMESISSTLLFKSSVLSAEAYGSVIDDTNHFLSPSLRIFPKPTIDFRMPASLSIPLILIGPGTGIAPFMGFLRHRQAIIRQHSSSGEYSTAAAAKAVVEGTWRGGFELHDDELAISQQDESGLNVAAEYRLNTMPQNEYGSVDVFFGCRYKDHDWLYRDEMNAMVETGIISKLYTAFSRKGTVNSHKYVQDIMLNDPECSSRLMDLICHQDAAVYVCGDGNAMAQDVQTAIVQLLQTLHFNGDEAQARAYLEEMKRKQRFLLDIWS